MQLYNRKHNVFVIRNCGHFFNQIGTFESKNFKLKEIVGTICCEDGLGYTEQNDQQYIDTPFLETLGWTGEWIGLFYDDVSEVGLFCTDFFGFGQIFYSIVQKRHERILIVGDSFRGVNMAVKNIQGRTGINWHIATPHLCSSVNIFATRCSFETFSQDIQVLHEDQMLLFSQRGISVITKPVETHLLALSYDELLARGIEKSAKIIQAACKLGRVNELALSGGKDSRAVLALIVAAGHHQDFTIFTAASYGVADGESREILDKDFTLACRLAEYFGLNWNCNGEYDEYHISFNEAINDWQNLRANSSFNLRPKWTQKIHKNEVRYTGGGGEVLRHLMGRAYQQGFPQWWASCGKTAASVRDDLGKLFRVICPFDERLDKDLYQQSLQAFVEAMDLCDGQNVYHQLNANDRKYDNRGHFAVAETNHAQGALLHTPLCLPEFVYAMQHLPYEQQEQGKVLFDILEYTVPELNTLPYASPPWAGGFQTRGKNVWDRISGSEMQKTYPDWETLSSRPILTRGFELCDFSVESQMRLMRNMDKLRQFALDNHLVFFNGLTERIARLQQKNEQHQLAMLAKTETLLDIIEDKPIHLYVSEFDLCRPSPQMVCLSSYLWR